MTEEMGDGSRMGGGGTYSFSMFRVYDAWWKVWLGGSVDAEVKLRVRRFRSSVRE